VLRLQLNVVVTGSLFVSVTDKGTVRLSFRVTVNVLDCEDDRDDKRVSDTWEREVVLVNEPANDIDADSVIDAVPNLVPVTVLLLVIRPDSLLVKFPIENVSVLFSVPVFVTDLQRDEEDEGLDVTGVVNVAVDESVSDLPPRETVEVSEPVAEAAMVLVRLTVCECVAEEVPEREEL
jgi:hypothetical protein